MEDCCESKHPDYSKLIPRINRAIGQLGGIKKMIEERRYCPEIIMQLRAVEFSLPVYRNNYASKAP